MGRAALLARLDQLLIGEPADRWVVVTGGPGMGKSALLAEWLSRREAVGEAVPHHFIRRGEYDWDDPAKLVGSLVAQIVARFPDQPEPEADARIHPAARLQATLQRVSQRELVPRGERLVVLIDGLDEYDPPADARASFPGRDPLADFLPHILPRGVSLLCASRPRHPYVDTLMERGALQLDLDGAELAADNAATVRAFWDQAAPELGLNAQFVAQAVDRAAGNPQHAEMLRKRLAGLPLDQRRVEDIPRGLAALLARTWERIATDAAIVDGLGVLCAAREPLTLDELAMVAGWTGAASRQAFVRGARELLIESERDDHAAQYRLHHDSIRAEVGRAIGEAGLRQHHRALARQLATWPAATGTAARRYALHHALIHRVEAGEWADTWRMAADATFLEAKCRELGVHDAEADVARTAARCRASGDETYGERLADLARALVRESHWLRSAPEATGALIWNRLRRWGWSASALDAQLRMPDGREFLRVRDAASRESPALVRDLVGHTSFVKACAVTPDGRRVISASEDKTLKIWELESGNVVATLHGHTDRVTVCAVTPDGRHVVSASWDRTLKVWELASGLEVATRRGQARWWVTAFAVTPDGRHVVSASEEEKTLRVWELASGRRVATLQGHTDDVTACALTPDGRHVVSASKDKTLKVWKLMSRRPVATLQGHTDRVTACAVTPDGWHVVSASDDKTLKVWELASGREVTTLQGHTHGVTACAVGPDSRHIVSASSDRTLKVWELASGREVTTLRGHVHGVTACAVTPDGRHVVSASYDETLKIWELARGRPVARLQGHTNWVRGCALTPDGSHVISASDDQTLKVWELASGREVATLGGHSDPVAACAVTPDGRHVVSASWDHTLKVWELASGREVARLQGHTNRVMACAVTPDGRHVVSASKDKTLKVWELASGREVTTLEGHLDEVTACVMTRDGRRLISASNDKTLKVWDLASGSEVARLEGHSRYVTACALTPDGRHIVSASWDQTLKVWELASGREVARLQGHTDYVQACAVTPDGRHVVSASYDQTLKIWDLATQTCRLTHRGDAGYLAVAVTTNTVIAGDRAGTVWFLDLPSSATSPPESAPPPSA